MAELTLEQKRAIALASARARAAADGAKPDFMEQIRAGAKEVSDRNRNSSVVEDLKGIGTSLDTAVRGAADTLSFGLADELAAGGDMLVNGNDYAKNLATERARDKLDAEERPGTRLTGQLIGGVTQGAGLVKNGVSLTADAIKAGKSLPKVMGAGTVEGGTLAALQGLGSGDGIEDRIKKALTNGAFGAVLGAATPAVISGAKSLVEPIAAYLKPDAAKDRVMAALLRRSGLSADDLAARLQGASDDGQNVFMAADALENPGQRALSNVARTPNDARKSVVDALKARQMDQGRRVAGDLVDASGSRQTAEQYQQILRAQRAEDAARNYAPVAADQTAIDVSPAVDRANKAISPVADNLATARGDVPTDLASRAPIEAQEASIRDPIRQALKEARSYLASDNLTVTNVEKAFRAKTNIDQMISKATENGQGAMVEALMPVQQQLDEALARTSPQYSSARDAYRTSSQHVDAVDAGRQMARPRNRIDDTLNTFGALPDEEAQKAARVGYFDPKIADAEKATGTMTDASRPYISERMRQELPAIAVPGQGDQLMRRLGRENTMSETTQQVLGGSKTADNQMDIADSVLDPGILSALAQGRVTDAIRSALTRTANSAKGMPPSVMERLAPALMESNPEAARALFSNSAQTQSLSDQARAKLVAALLATGSAPVPRLMTP